MLTGDVKGKRYPAGGALSSSIAVNSDNHATIMDAGAVEPLVQLLRTGDAAGKTNAAGTLNNIAVNGA